MGIVYSWWINIWGVLLLALAGGGGNAGKANEKV
jgi:hypothetical protein